ncbi:MAG TPA: IS630 family transposase [Variovorax sp.]|nr:IS630 family transposase [Variovorax sp.]
MPSPHAVAIVLTATDRAALEGWTRRRKTAQALAVRARIVLACAAPGATNLGVAQALGVSRPTVALWRRRFAARGPDGLLDEPRPGAPRRITDAQVERAVVATLEATPPNATHWSTRGLAAATGLSQTAVVRIWRAFALQPHRTEGFKLSRDPLFVDKVRDIVGLYMSPPERALVLCVDEKPSIRALERAAPVLPMRPGQVERRAHDYVRHGTTDLFAALDVKTGKVIAACRRRHRAREFRAFLDLVDRGVPSDLEVHLVLDNASTHKAPTIRRWLAKRPRYHLHFTPTSASWLNLVEGWFALLAARHLRRGTFRSTRALEQAIRAYIAGTNQDPKPFVWTKPADDILASVQRFCQRTSNPSH